MFGFDNLWRLDTASATLTDLTPAVRPVDWPSTGGEMAYDSVRGRLVMLGGGLDQGPRNLWELDPRGDDLAQPDPGPGARRRGVAGRRVRHRDSSRKPRPDGSSALPTSPIFRPQPNPALWSWDGAAGTWSMRLLVAGSRWPHNSSYSRLLAWDSGRGKLLAYDSEFRDLWQWGPGGHAGIATPDGIFYAGGPTPSRGRTSASAPRWPGIGRAPAVIFGGSNGGAPAVAFGDLWLWDPATGQMTSPPRPSTGWPQPRFNHAMAYDPVRRRVLMFGGALPEVNDELWALDTAQVRWERITPTGSWPPARGAHMLVLDEDWGCWCSRAATGHRTAARSTRRGSFPPAPAPGSNDRRVGGRGAFRPFTRPTRASFAASAWWG